MRPDLPNRIALLRQPLVRLLAVNLGIGIIISIIMMGGLLALNPGGLRHLIAADRAATTALGLLSFGFLITFGSAAMGSAIMALGRKAPDKRGGGKLEPAPIPARTR